MAAKDIRLLTFARLSELSKAKSSSTSPSTHQMEQLATIEPPLGVVRYELKHLLPTEPIVSMNQVEQVGRSPLIVIHPIEGSVQLLQSVMSLVSATKVYGLQCTVDTPLTSIEHLASIYIKRIKSIQPVGPYHLVGYSFGACIAVEMALQLQQQTSAGCGGDEGGVMSLILLDGSHSFVAAYTGQTKERLSLGSDTARTETEAICAFITHWVTRITDSQTAFADLDLQKLATNLLTQPNFDSRVDLATSALLTSGVVSSDLADSLRAAIASFYHKLAIADSYKPAGRLAASTCVTLIRASDSVACTKELGADYGLGTVCEGRVSVQIVDGSHESFVLEAGGGALAVSRLIDSVLSQ